MARRSRVERMVGDELWKPVETLLPQPARVKRGRIGRPRDPVTALLSLASALTSAD